MVFTTSRKDDFIQQEDGCFYFCCLWLYLPGRGWCNALIYFRFPRWHRLVFLIARPCWVEVLYHFSVFHLWIMIFFSLFLHDLFLSFLCICCLRNRGVLVRDLWLLRWRGGRGTSCRRRCGGRGGSLVFRGRDSFALCGSFCGCSSFRVGTLAMDLWDRSCGWVRRWSSCSVTVLHNFSETDWCIPSGRRGRSRWYFWFPTLWRPTDRTSSWWFSPWGCSYFVLGRWGSRFPSRSNILCYWCGGDVWVWRWISIWCVGIRWVRVVVAASVVMSWWWFCGEGRVAGFVCGGGRDVTVVGSLCGVIKWVRFRQCGGYFPFIW